MKAMAIVAAALLTLSAERGESRRSAPTTPIMGTVSAVTDTELDLTKPDGTAAAIKLSDKTRFAYVSAMTIADIQPNSYVGVGATTATDGTNTAVEVTVFPESGARRRRGTRALEPGAKSTMTNGTVAQVRRDQRAYPHGHLQGRPAGHHRARRHAGDDVRAGRQVGIGGRSDMCSSAPSRARTDSFTAGFVSIGKDGYVPKG